MLWQQDEVPKKKKNIEKRQETFKYHSQNRNLYLFNLPLSLPCSLSVPTILPLSQFAWNWKTRVWKGGIYMGLHAPIRTFPGTAHKCIYTCMSICMCWSVCVWVFLAWRTTQVHFPLPTSSQTHDCHQSYSNKAEVTWSVTPACPPHTQQSRSKIHARLKWTYEC